MPTATLDDYLARMSPYLPKQQAPVQVPQAQQINPLQLMVAQQLMSALQPQRSVTPAVPKNSMWLTPQMIQGAAQTNVAEQRLGQDQQALGQNQIAQVLQNQQAQERMGLERAQLQNQLNQPGAAEQAKLHTVGQILANEMMVERQAASQDAMLNRQIEVERQKRELPRTEQEIADLAYTQALTGAANRRGSSGADGTGLWTNPEISRAVESGELTLPEAAQIRAQGGRPLTTEQRVRIALSTLGGPTPPKSAKERTAEAKATIAERTAKGGLSEATARMYVNAELRNPGSVDSATLGAASEILGIPKKQTQGRSKRTAAELFAP